MILRWPRCHKKECVVDLWKSIYHLIEIELYGCNDANSTIYFCHMRARHDFRPYCNVPSRWGDDNWDTHYDCSFPRGLFIPPMVPSSEEKWSHNWCETARITLCDNVWGIRSSFFFLVKLLSGIKLWRQGYECQGYYFFPLILTREEIYQDDVGAAEENARWMKYHRRSQSCRKRRRMKYMWEPGVNEGRCKAVRTEQVRGRMYASRCQFLIERNLRLTA